MLVLPEVDLPGAWVVAEKIWTLVERCEGLRRNITVSLGIGLYQGNGLSADECIDQADKALYAAKAGGRNRTCVFGRDGPLGA
jgi:diguanylate cyclase (GGDEF)-like protein